MYLALQEHILDAFWNVGFIGNIDHLLEQVPLLNDANHLSTSFDGESPNLVLKRDCGSFPDFRFWLRRNQRLECNARRCSSKGILGVATESPYNISFCYHADELTISVTTTEPISCFDMTMSTEYTVWSESTVRTPFVIIDLTSRVCSIAAVTGYIIHV